MTKYKLIKLPDATIVVSDEDINENDNILTIDSRIIEVSYLLSKDVENGQKIIAGLPNLPVIKYRLKDEDAKKIGFVESPYVICKSCEKPITPKDINEHKFIKIIGGGLVHWKCRIADIPMELNDKSFNEADMVSFLYFSDSYKSKHGYKSNEELIYIWESLQTKIFDCNCELTENNKYCIITKIIN